jgi:hypothetical protein
MDNVMKKRSERRKRQGHFLIRVHEEEAERITDNAAAAQLKVPEFLRRLGQGFVPQSRIDQQAIRELCHSVADLGRLGGLLKLWMSETRASTSHGENVDLKSIEEVWRDIQIISGQLKDKVKSL